MASSSSLYRAGSLTSAGKALHLSQPAVSNHLKALEVELGRPLFVRMPRGISPTPAADALARSAAPHLDALESVSHAVSPRSSPLEGTALLGGPADFLATVAVPALAGLVARGIHLRCRTGLAAPLLQALAHAELDLVVASERRPHAGLAFEPLVVEEFVLVASPRLRRKLPTRLEEAPLVAFADELPILRRYFRAALGRRLTASAAVVLDDLRGVREAVKAGAGVSVLPRYLIQRELGARELVLLHRPRAPVTNQLYLASRTATSEHPRVALIRRTLLSALATRS